MSLIKRIIPCILLISGVCYSQKKSLRAETVTSSISINGKLDDPDWENAQVASDFVMYMPDNGKPENPGTKTEVRVLYDNNAIYIGAILYDNEPGKILKEITDRDDFGTSEHFGVYLNGFNDGQQDYRFFVSASGVQMDCLATETDEDFSWDAIWNSSVSITDFGWVVEMRIPYAALRFGNQKDQTWGLNFYRELRRYRQKFTWSFIDTNIGAVMTQAGLLEGIHDIHPPTRLFFIPYSSYYYDYTGGVADNKIKVGMDIKYGISDSFTLDAILVPDFGQTKFDNVVLNLTPFEQQFNENRPFFTEGTDLFNKGNLLYSRRIGGPPSTYPVTADNEVVSQYPNSVDLLNAIKISGRTKGGLGIGVLNAVTEETTANVTNTDTGQSRHVIVEPLTNYNLTVLDQRFNGNSSVSFVNTNVTRNGSYRDANVSALVWDLNTKGNTYKLAGDFKYSYINDAKDYDGFKTALNLIRTHGNNRFDILAKYISGGYDINDMGIAFINNYYSFYANYSYRILNPTEHFNTFKYSSSTSIEIQNSTGKIQDYFWNARFDFTLKKNDSFNIGMEMRPVETFDFYQPRVTGRYSYNPRSMLAYSIFSSNYNRKFAIDANPSMDASYEKGRYGYGFYLSPRYRITDRLLFSASFDLYKKFNDRGYIDQDDTNIYYGQRDRKTISTELTGRYSINNKMTINLTARYYWSYADYERLFTLNDDGYLTDFTASQQTIDSYNQNLSLWNFDLSYNWWFAPASQISVLYRNNSEYYSSLVDPRFGHNTKNVLDTPLNTVLSVSVRYYIDYNVFKSK
ncbi:DUF5916 domain-containing protein [Flavobacterium silvaticum]|uniref:Hydrolase n=1 Tax=Flavobacterium silvaticum TaxID=1852020 RepID=A0A972JIS3_9FLAO|nr:DUF5916 domain-containing protein [Flavobacterium silvaticum]NMH27492.1 hydrolase [Flavobacterium silvaticum]